MSASRHDWLELMAVVVGFLIALLGMLSMDDRVGWSALGVGVVVAVGGVILL